jgi:hypothetical protein
MFRTALTRTSLLASSSAPRLAIARTALARPALARGYHEKVISHYENPRNVSFKTRLDPSLGSTAPPTILLFCSSPNGYLIWLFRSVQCLKPMSTLVQGLSVLLRE